MVELTSMPSIRNSYGSVERPGLLSDSVKALLTRSTIAVGGAFAAVALGVVAGQALTPKDFAVAANSSDQVAVLPELPSIAALQTFALDNPPKDLTQAKASGDVVDAAPADAGPEPILASADSDDQNLGAEEITPGGADGSAAQSSTSLTASAASDVMAPRDASTSKSASISDTPT